MNKLLLASTALVASTTFAMADVDLSGSAEMGVMGMSDEDTDVEDRDLQFHTDIDVTFSMSGETDAGLTFGASIDLDESDDSDAFDADTQGGETIFVSGDFGTITMGDTDGAFDWALTEAIIGSSLADDHEHSGYNGNAGLDGIYDGQVVRYDYSFGDFAVAVSAEIDDGDLDVSDAAAEVAADGGFDGDPVFGIGMTYSGDFGGIDLGVGIGYQYVDANVFADDDATVADDGAFSSASADILGISASLGFANGFQAIINYSDLDGYDGNDSHTGLAVGYEFGDLLVAANYGIYDVDGGGDTEGFGLIANYDLGGGASLQAGYGNSDVDGDDNDTESYSFGIAMSF